MKRFALLFCISLFYSSHATQQQSDSVAMNFWSHLYPATPLRNVQALTMRLWGQLQHAYSNESYREVFIHEHQESFTKELVHLHSIFEVLFASLELQMHECSDCVVSALQDCQQNVKALTTMSECYDSIMADSNDGVYAPVVRYIFNALTEKLHHVLETGSVVSPLYALVRHPVSDRYFIKILPIATMA